MLAAMLAAFVGIAGTRLDAQAQSSPMIAVTQFPIALAVNPITNKIYVANRFTRTIKNQTFCDVRSKGTTIDGVTNAVWTNQLGFCPNAIAVNPITNKIYVVNQAGNDVTVIDGTTGDDYAKIPVGNSPSHIAVNPMTNTIYVTNAESASVSVIDGDSQTTVANVPVGHNPGPIAVNPVTNKVYVGNRGDLFYRGSISVIDAGNNNKTRTLPVPGPLGPGPRPTAIGVNPATNLIYVTVPAEPTTGWKPEIMIIDGATGNTNAVGAPALPIINPVAIAVNPVTNLVYVADAAKGSVVVLSWPAINNSPSWQSINVRGNPSSIVANTVTNKLYVGASLAGALTEIDGATNATKLLPDGAPLQPDVAVNSMTNKVYVANSSYNTVSVLGAPTPISQTVGVGASSSPQAADIDPITNRTYVANGLAPYMTVIDGATNTTEQIPLTGAQGGVAVNPLTHMVYVSNGTDVSVIDEKTNAVTTNIVVPFPGALAVNPVTDKVYVGSGIGVDFIRVIDAAHENKMKRVPTGTLPSFVAINEATDTIYVVNSLGNSVTVIDGATDTPITTVPTGMMPVAAAVNPLTNTIYVANENSNSVTVISGATNSVTATVPTGSGPVSLAVNPFTNTIFVANEGGNTLTAIAGCCNATIPVTVGANPIAVAVDSATNAVYVANNSSENATVIDTAGPYNSVTLPTALGPFFVAVNPVTNRAYVLNYSADTVTVISTQHAQAIPLTTAIQSLAGSVTSPTPAFTFMATSSFSPTAPPPDAVYYQFDTRQQKWTRATETGPGQFAGAVPATSPLLPGVHIIYAFATDGQEATKTSSPLVGSIAAYLFVVSPSAAKH